jgi:hypothetical protein
VVVCPEELRRFDLSLCRDEPPVNQDRATVFVMLGDAFFTDKTLKPSLAHALRLPVMGLRGGLAHL